MSWLKKSNSGWRISTQPSVTSFDKLPDDRGELRRMYFEGDAMVRAHVLHMLAEHGDWDIIEWAAKNETEQFPRSIAESELRRR